MRLYVSTSAMTQQTRLSCFKLVFWAVPAGIETHPHFPVLCTLSFSVQSTQVVLELADAEAKHAQLEKLWI